MSETHEQWLKREHPVVAFLDEFTNPGLKQLEIQKEISSETKKCLSGKFMGESSSMSSEMPQDLLHKQKEKKGAEAA